MLLLALAVLLSGGGVWALYVSDLLRVEKVGVDGTRVLTEAQVREEARVPLGTPMASLDKGAIERRLRKALPRLREAEVVRAWPHGVGLKVTERTPELLTRSGERYTEVDAEGVRYGHRDKPVRGVPLLRMEPREVSLRHYGAAGLRREAVRVASTLPDSVSGRARTVVVRSFDDISLELSGGVTVRWGSSERPRAKAVALAALRKATPKARHFDVSVPSAPASSGS